MIFSLQRQLEIVNLIYLLSVEWALENVENTQTGQKVVDKLTNKQTNWQTNQTLYRCCACAHGVITTHEDIGSDRPMHQQIYEMTHERPTYAPRRNQVTVLI